MILRAGLLGLLLLAPGLAPAETVPVRSGRHDGFTRLVLAFETGVDWRLGRTETGYTLRAVGRHDYDLSAAFDRISRARIRGIGVDPDTGDLKMDLGCDCHATGFEFAGTWVVLDFRDGPPAEDSHFEAPLPAMADSAAGPPVPASEALPLVIRRDPVPLVLPAQTGAGTGTTALLAPDAAIRGDAVADRERVRNSRSALLEQLGRAASQGLLASRAGELLDMLAAPPDTDMRGAETPAAPPPAAPPPQAMELPAHLNIHAETAVDRDRPRQGLPEGDHSGCIAPDRLDVAGWGAGTDPAAQIAAGRAALLGEFDIPRPGAAVRLARLYIHLGFGAEALAVLRQFAGGEADDGVLRALAVVVDGAEPVEPDPFRDQIGCPGPAAFWSALAHRDLSVGTPMRKKDVLWEFSGLPLALRRHLGPLFADRLLRAGHPDMARAIRDAIARGGTPGDSALELLNARLGLATAAETEATAGLGRVVAADDAHSAIAVIELIDHLLETGAAVPAGLLLQTSALAFEHRRAPLGPRLKRAEILALARNGDHAEAFLRLRQAETGDAAQPQPNGLAAELVHVLIDRAGEAEFAIVFFAERARIAGTLETPGLRYDLARRLGLGGLPAVALEVLDTGPQPPALQDRLLRAELRIDLDDPGTALAELRGLPGDAARALRVRALERSGDYRAALAATAESGDAAHLPALAWRAGDWERVRQGEETLRKRAVELAIAPAAGAAPPSLEAGRGLLEESRGARDVLGALLQTVASDPPAPEG